MTKKIIKLSATRIGSYLKCKRKYWFQYVEHMPKLSNPAFKLGLACHESLELAGKFWMDEGKLSKAAYKEIFEYYDKISVREGISEMEVHAQGKILVKNRLDNFALGTKIVSLEEKFGFGKGTKDIVTSQGVPLIGAMDKVVELDPETIVVVDYKTSKTAPTYDQLKEDLQLSLYDLVAGILYPQYPRVILCLDMLKSEPVYTYRTPFQREELNNYLTVIHKEMSSIKEKDAYESLNVFCPWCDFKDYCEAYQKAATQTKYDFLPTSKMSDEALIEEHERVKGVAKILEMRKRDLAMILMEKIKTAGTDLKGGSSQMYIRQSARTNYDAKGLHKLIPPDEFATMVSLNKKAVDAYCSKHPKLKKEIEKNATTNYTSPFLAVKKIKEPKPIKKKGATKKNGKKKTK